LEALVPILVRPVREQLEHDRIIRLLEAKWRRKFKVDANPGDERNGGIKVPSGTLFPDLVLTEEGGRKPKALVEVETSESVNHLEARAQWAHLAKSRTSLLLFVPAGAVESARRLADENAIKVSELWTYLVLGDQVRFTSVFREHGLEPADLVEKAEVFTTERSAPVPRPVLVDPPVPEPVVPAAAPVPVPDRPRKLAVKVGSRPAAAVEPLSKPTPKIAVKAAPAPPAPVAAVAKAALTAAKPVKVEAAKVAPPPPKVAAPKPVEKKAAEKPAAKAPPEKVVAVAKVPDKKKAPDKVESKVTPVKAAPPKVVARKVVPVKPAPAKAVVKKAAPAKAAPKPAAKKAAPAAKSAKTAKRK
jgi:hypothetical protein